MSDFFGHKYNLDLFDMGSEPDEISFPGRKFIWGAVLSDHLTGHLLACVPLESKKSLEVCVLYLHFFT